MHRCFQGSWRVLGSFVWLAAALLVWNESSAGSPALVLQFSQSQPLLPADDPVPLLRVYEDGRVLVHRPASFKQAGDYELQLEPQELSALLQALAAHGLMQFDVEQTRRLKEQAVAQARSSGQSVDASDGSRSEFEIHLRSFVLPGTGRVVSELHHRVVWSQVEADAVFYRGIEPLQGLAAAQDELWSLIRRAVRQGRKL